MYEQNNTELFHSALNFIEKMLLLEKINIFDIPIEIRTSLSSFYVTACRVARVYGIREYKQIIQLLKDDIESVDNVYLYSLNNTLNNLEENILLIEDEDEK